MAQVNAVCFECKRLLTPYDVHDCCCAFLDALRTYEDEQNYYALILEGIDCTLVCYDCAIMELRLYEYFEEGVHTCQ